MKTILSAAVIALVGLVGMSSQSVVAVDGDSTSGGETPPLTAPVTCMRPQDRTVLFEGTVLAVKGSPDGSSSDTAVVQDQNGVIYQTEGFGLTGEVLTTVDEQQPHVRRLELGQALQVDPPERDLIFCSFSSVSSETRPLTPDDVDALGVDEDLVGAVADIETSIQGIVWVLPPSP